MAWIESHQTLARHPKTRKFARLAGVSIPQAIGHLHLLWWWAMDYAQDGILADFDNADIADAALWEGDPQVLLDALLTCGNPGFLEMCEGVYHIHDWDEYAGKLIGMREANARRQKAWRDRHRNDPIDEDNGDVTVTSQLHNPTTVPNPTIHNLTVPKTTQPGGESRAHASPHPLPDEFTLTDEMKLWAKRELPGLDVLTETETWLDAMRSNTNKYRYTDWQAAWRKDMRKAVKWDTGGVNGNGAHRQNAAEVRPTEIRGPNRAGLRDALEESASKARNA